MRHILLLLLLGVTACASTAPAAKYVAPTGNRPSLASISGSQVKSTSFLMADATAFIAGIDGSEVGGGKKNWKQSVPLPTGERKISASFSLGSYKANADIKFNALPDHAYRLQAKSNAKVIGGTYYCDFWVIDIGDDRTVSDVVRADIRYTKIIFVP